MPKVLSCFPWCHILFPEALSCFQKPFPANIFFDFFSDNLCSKFLLIFAFLFYLIFFIFNFSFFAFFSPSFRIFFIFHLSFLSFQTLFIIRKANLCFLLISFHFFSSFSTYYFDTLSWAFLPLFILFIFLMLSQFKYIFFSVTVCSRKRHKLRLLT